MTDERLEEVVGNLLRVGVVVAAAVVLAGGAWFLAAHGSTLPQYREFRPVVHGIRSFANLSVPEAIMMAGLLILIATPVARVAVTLAAFALKRDHEYVVITLIVLIVLLYSIGTSWLF